MAALEDESRNEDQEELAESVLLALSSSLQYDDSSFYHSPSRFQRLLNSLMRRLEQTPSDGQNMEQAVKTTVDFARNISPLPDHLDKVTDGLLKLGKHSSARVRLTAIRTMHAMTETEGVGAEWLGQCLPRMKQVVAELQEDDEEEVERETVRWIKAMETCTGERLEDTLS